MSGGWRLKKLAWFALSVTAVVCAAYLVHGYLFKYSGRFFETLVSGRGPLASSLLVFSSFFLVTRRGFWRLVFLFTGFAACFLMISSFMSFQVSGAIGYFVAMVMLWSLCNALR